MTKLTIERLKEVLDYDPSTGHFRWRVRMRRKKMTSEFAGTVNPNGYRQICIDQEMHKAHRLAWFYVHAQWPTKRHIDHINGVRDDNRIANLREADWSENHANSKCRVTNKVGLKGVSFHPFSSLYVARVVKDGKHAYCGYFKTPEEAAEAYKVNAARIFGEFARAA